MPAQPFEYAVVRVVPRVEREEFVNAGILLYCEAHDVLRVKVALDEARLQAFSPDVDLDLVRAHLDALDPICRGADEGGEIAKLPVRERWRWLVSPKSTILQTSPAHGGMTSDPEATLERLLATIVRR